MVRRSMGELIKKQRIEKGLSQSNLAEQIGITRQSISKWETNTSRPDYENLISLCEILDLPIDIIDDKKYIVEGSKKYE